ncbi:von willebrand factor A domain protein [Melia azedarach]|uniref:von willebrand factor A domain protein n=1 Tax=Melia azedarach TaxID=155640 RepID=A0ACC1YK79_MELAZ|nr:von willebrand factor A domain protein [Melia azedarach]
MLRFRPIAPKPVTSGTVSGNLLVDNKNLLLTGKRSKRKYVKVRKNNGYNNKRKNIRIETEEEQEVDDDLNRNVVTLQLLPEKTTDMKEEQTWCNNLVVDPVLSAKVDDIRQDPSPNWLNFNGDHGVMMDGVGGFGFLDQSAVMSSQRGVTVTTVESWVTVESVTDTCMDTRGLGSTDVERMRNLEKDTCPGFISDGLNRVSWVNEAYKKMVTEGQENHDGKPSPEVDIMVRLVMKEKFPSLNDYYTSSFTTKVRLQYSTWQKEKYSKVVLCDVFRMDGGGFAWRLDVEAALSLGR